MLQTDLVIIFRFENESLSFDFEVAKTVGALLAAWPTFSKKTGKTHCPQQSIG